MLRNDFLFFVRNSFEKFHDTVAMINGKTSSVSTTLIVRILEVHAGYFPREERSGFVFLIIMRIVEGWCNKPGGIPYSRANKRNTENCDARGALKYSFFSFCGRSRLTPILQNNLFSTGSAFIVFNLTNQKFNSRFRLKDTESLCPRIIYNLSLGSY